MKKMKPKFKKEQINDIIHLVQLLYESDNDNDNDDDNDDDFDEPNLVTSAKINGEEVEFQFNYFFDFMPVDAINLSVNVLNKKTGKAICHITFHIFLELFVNDWESILFSSDTASHNMHHTFMNLFYCDDDDIKEDDISLSNQDESKYFDYSNTPIWIHLDDMEVYEEYRGKGYGQAILKYLIDLFGLNKNNELYDYFSTNEIVLSVYPYPIDMVMYDITKPNEKEIFDLKLKSIQNFYKQVGFYDFYDRGYFVYMA
jgi:GNAT superfamily N-acetyltransferase